jgi:hypothetical protein
LKADGAFDLHGSSSRPETILKAMKPMLKSLDSLESATSAVELELSIAEAGLSIPDSASVNLRICATWNLNLIEHSIHSDLSGLFQSTEMILGS